MHYKNTSPMNMENETREKSSDRVKSAIKTYETELATRQSHEQEIRFLRRSLRESERLRRLAKQKQRNQRNEIDNAISNLGYCSEENRLDSRSSFNLSDVPSFINHLRRTLRRRKLEVGDTFDFNLDEQEWNWLAQVLNTDKLVKSYAVHDFLAKALETTRHHMDGVPKHQWAEGNNLAQLTNDVNEYLNRRVKEVPRSYSSDIHELMNILNKPACRQLFLSHDGVADLWYDENKKAELSLNAFSPKHLKETNLSVQIDSRRITQVITEREKIYETCVPGCYWKLADAQNNSNLRLVVFNKMEDEYLGVTVKSSNASIVVSRVIKGSLVERTGLLSDGDELIWVNGVELLRKDVNFVHDFLKEQHGQIEFLVSPSKDGFVTATRYLSNEPSVYLRTLFSYSPEEDHFMPCKDLCLPFLKGDILEIVSTKDPHWWQAVRIERDEKVGSWGELAGLIPSPQYQFNRSILRIKSDLESDRQHTLDLMNKFESSSEDENSVANGVIYRKASLMSPNLSGKITRNGIDSASFYGISDISLVISSMTFMTNGGVAQSIYLGRIEGLTGNVENDDDLREWCQSSIVWGIHGFSLKNLRRRIKQKNILKSKNSMLNCAGGENGDSRLFKRNKKNNHLNSILPKPTQDLDPINWLESQELKLKIKHPFLLTYEPVAEFFPEPKRRRPLVLVGPAHIGRHLVVNGLLEYDPRKFTTVDMHTTNPSVQPNENQRFILISKQDFEMRYRNKEFLEIGIINRHYYGTLKSSLETIIKSGRIALITLRPESIRSMRNTGLMPFVLFITPPDRVMDVERVNKNLQLDVDCSRRECQFCLEACRNAEIQHGHWFDETLIMDTNLGQAVEIIADLVLKLERETQWVPKRWLTLAQRFTNN